MAIDNPKDKSDAEKLAKQLELKGITDKLVLDGIDEILHVFFTSFFLCFWILVFL